MKRKILAAVFWAVTATSAFTGTDLILAAEKTEETAVQKPDMEGIDTENTKIGISIYHFVSDRACTLSDRGTGL